MTLEEALRVELMEIVGLQNKIYFLGGQEGIVAPYLIITSGNGKYDKSLDGFCTSKSVTVTFNIVHNRYSSMKSLVDNVVDKLKSFEQRKLAKTGYYIQQISFVGEGTEIYEKEVNLYRTAISTKIYFNEER